MFSYDYFNMQQCLLLILCFMLFDQVLTQLLPIIKQTVMFGNVSLIREIRFSENTTLLDDIKLLDSVFEEQINKKEEEKNKLLIKQKNKKIIKRQPKIRILLVGDHSLFEKFFGLYGEDEYSAYNGLTIYLNGIFNQLKSVFNNQLPFLTQFSIQLEMVGVPMIILRPEDCPFRGNLINLNKTLFNSSFLLNNSSSLIENNFIWNSIDSLLAVQWASQWVREYEPTGSLPLHEHVMIITGLVSGNVF